jgi:energy-coupling factor transporter ATP-binding protein EcfA2
MQAVAANNIEMNEQFVEACELIENTNKSLFITGNAGTGKSTLLRHIKSTCKNKMVVLAPTGIAALNVEGQTIHSFFNLPHRIILPKELSFANSVKLDTMKKLETLIIDEVSMVRADILDGIDYILKVVRKNGKPFGGVQLVLFGDLHQLPPVVNREEEPVFASLYPAPYFFNAKAFQQCKIHTINLTKIYRQSDYIFIGILNRIRENKCTDSDLQILNARVDDPEIPGRQYVNLTTTNAIANKINMENLNRLKTPLHTYQARVIGNFDESSFPTYYMLALREGAQVMFVKNDSKANGNRWVNGTIGVVEKLDRNDDGVIVKVRVGKEVFDVDPVTWEKTEYRAQGDDIEAHSVGSFTQIPLKLAWAITIHKSQGQTFSHVIINLGNGTFAHGQLYVALSRCTSLEGMILVRPVQQSDVIFDERIREFV